MCRSLPGSLPIIPIRCSQMSICHPYSTSCQITRFAPNVRGGKKKREGGENAPVQSRASSPANVALKSCRIKKFSRRKGEGKRSPLCGISIMLFPPFPPLLHLCFFNRGPRLISERFSPIFLSGSSFSLKVPVGAPLIVYYISQLARRERIRRPVFYYGPCL